MGKGIFHFDFTLMMPAIMMQLDPRKIANVITSPQNAHPMAAVKMIEVYVYCPTLPAAARL